jgi:hypothetical protein
MISLDNISIDMHGIDYLVKKVFNRELSEENYYIMLKNKHMYLVNVYGKLVELNEISPEDAFMYVDFASISEGDSYKDLVAYLFPFLDENSTYGIVKGYLSKIGFYDPDRYSVYPATGLKYYAVERLLSDRVVIEIVDFYTVVTNTGLNKIIVDVLGKGTLTQKKEISYKQIHDYKQIHEIVGRLRKQKLFAGHNMDDVYDIIYDYYVENTSLAKDVLAINNAYDQIFQPYRVVYDTNTRQQVLS